MLRSVVEQVNTRKEGASVSLSTRLAYASQLCGPVVGVSSCTSNLFLPRLTRNETRRDGGRSGGWAPLAFGVVCLRGFDTQGVSGGRLVCVCVSGGLGGWENSKGVHAYRRTARTAGRRVRWERRTSRRDGLVCGQEWDGRSGRGGDGCACGIVIAEKGQHPGGIVLEGRSRSRRDGVCESGVMMIASAHHHYGRAASVENPREGGRV